MNVPANVPEPAQIPAALRNVLEAARKRRFLGPAPVGVQVDHALGFARTVAGDGPGSWLDLGAGGGVPGLVLAWSWVDSHAVLLDSARRRATFLTEATAALGWGERVTVVWARAEEAGRDPVFRAAFDAVVARSFAPPAVTAECAAPFLRQGGVLVVSEPPPKDGGPDATAETSHPNPRDGTNGRGPGGSPQPAPPGSSRARWPSRELAGLGLVPEKTVIDPKGFTYQVLVQRSPCPDRYPRRPGVPARRPLYR